MLVSILSVYLLYTWLESLDCRDSIDADTLRYNVQVPSTPLSDQSQGRFQLTK